MIHGQKPSDDELLRFQLRRETTVLFKQQLEILEDLKEEHYNALQKLIDNLPEPYKKYVNLADYFTDEKFNTLRKRTLQRGNDTIRNMETIVNDFDIKLKE